MGTNFHLDTPTGKVHVGKRSAGWAFTFNAPTVGDSQPRTRSDWERLVAMLGGVVTDEQGRQFTAAEFFAQVDATTGGQRFVDRLDDGAGWCQRLQARGDVWADPQGWSFHRGEWC